MKFARLGKIEDEVDIVSNKSYKLKNGTTIYSSTIKRNKPAKPAKDK